jgi:hypothetical protein
MSNSAAGTVTVLVDGIAWLLRKAGVPVPAAPVGGSDWMEQKGLLAQPKNRNAGLLGEAVGGVLPIVAAAKAPQIAKGLLQMGENAAQPSAMQNAGQRGALYVGNQKVADNIYHGTDKPFSGRVSFEAAEDMRSNMNMGDAFWMTPDYRHASGYSLNGRNAPLPGKSKVLEGNVFLKNPMTVDAWDEAVKLADDIGVEAPKSWPEAANLLQYADWAKDMLSTAKSRGHDALIIKRTGDAPIPHSDLRLSDQLADHVAILKENRVRSLK